MSMIRRKKKASSFKSVKKKRRHFEGVWCRKAYIILRKRAWVSEGICIAYFCCLATASTVCPVQLQSEVFLLLENIFRTADLCNGRLYRKLRLCSNTVIDTIDDFIFYICLLKKLRILCYFKQNSKHCGPRLWELGNSITVKFEE